MTADQLAFGIDLPSHRLDAERVAVLDLIAGSRTFRADRDAIVDAIFYVAARCNRRIDPNMVRARLTDPQQSDVLTVHSQVIGAVYHALAAKGVIRADGWIPSTDRAGGNYGKPCRLYYLVAP